MSAPLIDPRAAAAFVAELLRHAEVRAALADALAPCLEQVVRAELTARAEQLQPLADILRISRKAAAARIRNDVGLRALGVPSGQRLVFRASDVEAYLRSRRGGARAHSEDEAAIVPLRTVKEVRRG